MANKSIASGSNPLENLTFTLTLIVKINFLQLKQIFRILSREYANPGLK